MDKFDASIRFDRIADVYDANLGGTWQVDNAVLRDLAGNGRALELGIGTGRVALPLASSGIEVHGIDGSEGMVAEMRKKPGGDDIPVTMGDFSDFQLDETFRMVYIVFNTFFDLVTQEDQVNCFDSVAKHLDDDGVFLIEAFVPDPARLAAGSAVNTTRVETDFVDLDASIQDVANQTVSAQRVSISESGIRMHHILLRYAYPPELDLMARLAGLSLRDRWADWNKAPFETGSGKHISVYERVR